MKKETIIKLIKTASENKELVNQKFHLTLNFKQVIKDEYVYKEHKNPSGHGVTLEHIDTIYPLLNEEFIKKSEELINNTDELESFNFTVEFEEGTGKINGNGKYDKNWYHIRLVFWGKDEIQISFDSLSDRYGLSDSDFRRFSGKKVVIMDKYKMEETIQNLIDLKNILLKNGDKVAKQIKKIS